MNKHYFFFFFLIMVSGTSVEEGYACTLGRIEQLRALRAQKMEEEAQAQTRRLAEDAQARQRAELAAAQTRAAEQARRAAEEARIRQTAETQAQAHARQMAELVLARQSAEAQIRRLEAENQDKARQLEEARNQTQRMAAETQVRDQQMAEAVLARQTAEAQIQQLEEEKQRIAEEVENLKRKFASPEKETSSSYGSMPSYSGLTAKELADKREEDNKRIQDKLQLILDNYNNEEDVEQKIEYYEALKKSPFRKRMSYEAYKKDKALDDQETQILEARIAEQEKEELEKQKIELGVILNNLREQFNNLDKDGKEANIKKYQKENLWKMLYLAQPGKEKEFDLPGTFGDIYKMDYQKQQYLKIFSLNELKALKIVVINLEEPNKTGYHLQFIREKISGIVNSTPITKKRNEKTENTPSFMQPLKNKQTNPSVQNIKKQRRRSSPAASPAKKPVFRVFPSNTNVPHPSAAPSPVFFNGAPPPPPPNFNVSMGSAPPPPPPSNNNKRGAKTKTQVPQEDIMAQVLAGVKAKAAEREAKAKAAELQSKTETNQ